MMHSQKNIKSALWV